MMTCEEFMKWVDKYVDGEEPINIMTRIEIRVHIDSCAECRKIYVQKRTEKSIRMHDVP